MEIWLTKISDIIGEFEKEKPYALLPACRREAARAYFDGSAEQKEKRAGAFAGSLGAGLLLGACMKKQGVSLEETPCFGVKGKLYFPQQEKFYVNLSHAGEYAALAYDDREAGVDLEGVRPFRKAVAERVFTQEELKELYRLQGGARDARFTGLWTRKESAAKLTGEGLSALLSAEGADGIDRAPILIRTYQPVKGYYLSVASYRDSFPEEIVIVAAASLLSPALPKRIRQ